MSPNPPRPDLPELALSAQVQQEVARLAASPEVRSAFNWFRLQEPQLAHWQMEMARIPAPPFGESSRAEWLAERFREVGLDDVRIDDVGNVFGIHPGFGRRYLALSAHIDTVFPANTPLNIRQQGSRIYGPGVSDNGAGVAALLGIAALLRAVRIRHALPFVFIGNVGEEGEGDLRGMRHIFSTPRWKDSIAYSLVLDGAGADTIVAGAVKHQAVGDGIFPAGRGKNVAHAAQVAFALFADIADEDKRKRVTDAHRPQHGGDAEHGGHAGAVVGNSRAVEAASLLADVQRRVRRKNRVDVRAEGDVAASETGMRTEDVANVVDADIVERNFAKTFGEPLGAGRLAERRRGDAGHLHLPLGQLGLVRAKPVEGGAHFG